MLDADFGAALKALAPYLSAQANQAVHQDQPIIQDNLNAIRSALVNTIQTDELRPPAFAYDSKWLKREREVMLLGACQMRASTLKTRKMLGVADKPYPDAYPPSLKVTLDNLKYDDDSLRSNCTSKEAVKLLKKHATKAKHPDNYAVVEPGAPS